VRAVALIALVACGSPSANHDVDAAAGTDGTSDTGHADAHVAPHPDAHVTPPPDAMTIPPNGKRVFVTSQRYPADLRTAGGQATGRASADAICQQLADASALGGTFVAWLSTTDLDAIDHITGTGPWYRMDGHMVFANRANLGTVPPVAITIDETHGTPDPYYESWTGTGLGGHRAPLGGRTSVTCNDWTTTVLSDATGGELGIFGNGFGDDVGHGPDWTQFTVGYCSPFARHLYCFEQG
jgi:hypothetical protein